MVGLIFKVFTMIAGVIAVVLIVLAITHTWEPGTLSLSQPKLEPCQRYAKAAFAQNPPKIIDVRWLLTAKNYGWGCYFEFSDFTSETVTPMPK
jgi:hypothetical protein